MGFRFRRSIRLGPGLRVNLSKSGVSTSAGTPGATVNLRGDRVRSTIGIPGSGLSYSEQRRGGAGGVVVLVVVVLFVLAVAFGVL